jgi:uncharacterized protein (DUF427 family)
MSLRLRDLLMGRLDELRHEPIEKRIRGMLGDRTVVDSTRAVLVWEPKRIVASYAVPAGDIAAEIVSTPAAAADRPPAFEAPQLAGRPVLDPSVPFAVHTTDGEPVVISTDDRAAIVGFRPSDEALAGHVILDFGAFDAWYEEDELNVGHPRDPFHRIEIIHSSRHVRVEHDGEILADSTSPYMLFEPPLPVRYYLPPEDVATDRLRASATTTFCAYKGRAEYRSADGADDIAWTYREPLREAAEVTDRIAFFNERVDIVVDGVRTERPVTPWSRR